MSLAQQSQYHERVILRVNCVYMSPEISRDTRLNELDRSPPSIVYTPYKSMYFVINIPWFMCTYAKVCPFYVSVHFSSLHVNGTHQKLFVYIFLLFAFNLVVFVFFVFFVLFCYICAFSSSVPQNKSNHHINKSSRIRRKIHGMKFMRSIKCDVRKINIHRIWWI